MASDDGDKWKGVRNLIHKFDFAKEMQASLQTQMETDAASKETSEAEKARMEQSILKIHRSDEKNVQTRSTKRSDKRKCVIFQELPEQVKIEDLQNDFKSPVQIPPLRKMLSVCSVDLSVSKKQETTKNKLIVLCRNVIEQNKKDAGIKFVEPADTKREVLQGDTNKEKEEFEIDKLQVELKEVTRIVLHLESEMHQAKERLTKLSQQLEDKKSEQQRNRNKQLQNKKDEQVVETLNKETQTTKIDNVMEAFDTLQNDIMTQPKQDKLDDEKTTMPYAIKSEENSVRKANEKVNLTLGKDRQDANDSNEVVVEKTQLANSHVEMLGSDKQKNEHETISFKLAVKETDSEAIKVSTEFRTIQEKEDTEIATHDEDQYTTASHSNENITKTTSQERHLDSTTYENYQCMDKNALTLDETELRAELAEKSDTVHYQFSTTNQVNQYLDFSDAITRELDLKNKRKSEYPKGWNSDIIKEEYCVENTFQELDSSTEQTRRMNTDIQKNLVEATSEQRLDKATDIKTKTEMPSSESDLTIAEKEDKILSVKPCDDASKAIWGVTKVRDELFVLRDSSLSSEVWLLKEESFEHLWKVRGKPMDMAGDSRNQYLYISRCIEPDNEIVISVHEINESKRPSETPKHSWGVSSGRYVTLSITAESNVLLTLMESRKLVEYTYNGEVEKVYREIAIRNIANPLHAVKQTKDTYVVCHGENRDENHRVCIVNARGYLLKDICLRTYSGMNMSVVPIYLALGKGGSIIVAENRNDRVVQLNADLTVENVLLTINDGLRGPCRLHLDEICGQIIVADNEHGWRDGKLLIRDI